MNSLKNAAEAIGAAISSEKTFPEPTLFLYGEHSNYIDPPADKESILEAFPKAELKEIKSAGHWLHAEQPQTFFDILMDWLS